MERPPVETRELIAALSRPEAYPGSVGAVEVIHTHASAIFLVGDRAYKLKKPVDLGFLDFSTLARRREACEAEVRLNAELAPDVYRCVRDIVRTDGGQLRVGGEGDVVDVVLEMRRLPAAGMLDRRLREGLVDNELIERLAGLLARFHAGARTGPGVDELGEPAGVAFNVRENFEQTAAFIGGLDDPDAAFTPQLHAFLAAGAERFLAGHEELLWRRVRGGRIREGHGDLHAGNVCLVDGQLVVYDRIEFAERLRCCDVATDVGFLAMDLDDRGFRGFSGFLVRRYGELATDPELPLLVPFAKGYRALVRAKVACIGSADPALGGDRRRERLREARRYAALAASYELPPALVLLCGLPASGKSTVAAASARPFEAVVLASDVRRRRLVGAPARGHAPVPFASGAYGPEMTERTYASLLASAREALGRGRTVVVDATFARRALRAPFVALARELGAPLVVVHVTASEVETLARLGARALDPAVVSDADAAIWRRLRATFEPPRELESRFVTELSSPSEPERVALAVVDCLVRQVAGRART